MMMIKKRAWNAHIRRKSEQTFWKRLICLMWNNYQLFHFILMEHIIIIVMMYDKYRSSFHRFWYHFDVLKFVRKTDEDFLFSATVEINNMQYHHFINNLSSCFLYSFTHYSQCMNVLVDEHDTILTEEVVYASFLEIVSSCFNYIALLSLFVLLLLLLSLLLCHC